ncbi:hypothetical protein Val02_35770 [Virgisporangium aliadipatigenens]|uniref:Transcription factor zinc-finger domain-containing protein n=2 Tax=Virgisporangium aliadipatigenens TaxID=741659 RepID=A0A8J4DR46_9ACTN|nr:hypothetical protein Val02_35770 [Virgisporangium aliadipatigenens]
MGPQMPYNSMQCPRCRAPMRSYPRSGVQIERCDQCRGIFLDEGELETLQRNEMAQWQGGAPPPGYGGYGPQGGYPPPGGYNQQYNPYGGGAVWQSTDPNNPPPGADPYGGR